MCAAAECAYLQSDLVVKRRYRQVCRLLGEEGHVPIPHRPARLLVMHDTRLCNVATQLEEAAQLLLRVSCMGVHTQDQQDSSLNHIGVVGPLLLLLLGPANDD